ncbi:MAG TPA: hypothetical protein PLS50_06735 [Candidatus Dojkabacteria bacterium]|nr:hypothetical protein [Candidatus Dojkabacteria bacterium]
MKVKDKIFYIVCCILIAITIVFFLNLWYKFIPSSYVDKYVILSFFTIIGLSLLPFADKLKIGNLFEIERLREKIEEVQLHQYLGEIIRTPRGEILYYDSEGTHKLPDIETTDFLMTNKGEVLVTKEIIDQMKPSFPMDSVKTARIIKWRDRHIYLILNDKKYWINLTELSDIGISDNDAKPVTDAEIKRIPSGR